MKAVSFNRTHTEYEHGYIKPKCTTFDPRPLRDSEIFVDWNKLVTVTVNNAHLYSFSNPKYHPIISMSTVLRHLSPNH